MDKLIIILSLFIFIACAKQVEQNSHCQSITDIGIQEINSYIKTLDTIETVASKIIEYRIDNDNKDYFYAEMFVSKPYLKGQVLPRYWHKMKVEGRDIYLFQKKTALIF